jgi:hypothetical protein
MGERIERHCVRCGEIFPAQRISARFCGGRCLQQAYLDRHRPPAPPGFGGVLSWADFERLIWRPTPPAHG